MGISPKTSCCTYNSQCIERHVILLSLWNTLWGKLSLFTNEVETLSCHGSLLRFGIESLSDISHYLADSLLASQLGGLGKPQRTVQSRALFHLTAFCCFPLLWAWLFKDLSELTIDVHPALSGRQHIKRCRELPFRCRSRTLNAVEFIKQISELKLKGWKRLKQENADKRCPR